MDTGPGVDRVATNARDVLPGQRARDVSPELGALEQVAACHTRAHQGRPRRFPPEEVAWVKAVACELPEDLRWMIEW